LLCQQRALGRAVSDIAQEHFNLLLMLSDITLT
jgi:hypothetical protein